MLPGLEDDGCESNSWVLLHEVVAKARLQHEHGALRKTIPLDLAAFDDGEADWIIHGLVASMNELE